MSGETRTHVCTHTLTHIHTCTRTHPCTHVRICTHMHTCRYTHSHAHTRIHTQNTSCKVLASKHFLAGPGPAAGRGRGGGKCAMEGKNLGQISAHPQTSYQILRWFSETLRWLAVRNSSFMTLTGSWRITCSKHSNLLYQTACHVLIQYHP